MPISDNKSFRDAHQQLQFIKFMARLIPSLRLVGHDDERFWSSVESLPKLESHLSGLRSRPDRFNAHFLRYGWIAYDDQNSEIAQHAVDLAEAGDSDAADLFLIDSVT